MSRYLIALLICVSALASAGQSSIRDSVINLSAINLSYGYYLPFADMGERFGGFSNVHASYNIKTRKNWMLSAEGGLMFGNQIEVDSMFKNISTSDGQIIGNDGKAATVRVYQRGYTITVNGGKLFPIGKPNKNSGVVVMVGAGFVQHKIRIETLGNTVEYLNKQYKKGYDRLTNGLLIRQYIGYQYLGNKQLVNFHFGIDINQGFTQGRRSYLFETGLPDNAKRTELFIGIRAGWSLPLYKRASDKFYVD
ncbi:MAG: hypothetical protein IPO27_10085 [Bacteroidetes bacterium]|nr:hypothetical protein [Bacteroidota bacterium]